MTFREMRDGALTFQLSCGHRGSISDSRACLRYWDDGSRTEIACVESDNGRVAFAVDAIVNQVIVEDVLLAVGDDNDHVEVRAGELLPPDIKASLQPRWAQDGARTQREATRREQIRLQELREQERRDQLARDEHQRRERYETSKREEAAREREEIRVKRAKERETEPCSMQNAEEEHRQANKNAADSLTVRQRLQRCIVTRSAPCQQRVDADDLSGAATCWSQRSWSNNSNDRVDGDSSYNNQDVEACLRETADWQNQARTCAGLPERTDEQIVAKANCLLTMQQHWRPHRCGALDLSGYLVRSETSLNISSERSRLAKLAEQPRAKLTARDSACSSYSTIELMEQQMAQQRAIEHASGVVDLATKREIGTALVYLRSSQRRSLADFRRLWRRAFNRARDCKHKH